MRFGGVKSEISENFEMDPNRKLKVLENKVVLDF